MLSLFIVRMTELTIFFCHGIKSFKALQLRLHWTVPTKNNSFEHRTKQLFEEIEYANKW